MKQYNTDDVDGEKGYELRAAFGEDTEIVEYEEEDLQPVKSPDYILPEVLEEGDWITIRHSAGNVTTGPVTEIESYGVTIEPKNRTAAGFFGFSTLGVEGAEVPLDTPKDEPRSEVIDINGEPAHRVVGE